MRISILFAVVFCCVLFGFKENESTSIYGLDDVLMQNQSLTNPYSVDLGNYGLGFYNGGDLMGYYDNVDHCGYFGINTQDPQCALDVVGSLKVHSTNCGASVNFATLPVFDSESEAFDLTTGDLYRTSTGELRIKL